MLDEKDSRGSLVDCPPMQEKKKPTAESLRGRFSKLSFFQAVHWRNQRSIGKIDRIN
jgi:hypothetical protein